MSKELRLVSFRIEEDIYQEISDYAREEGMKIQYALGKIVKKGWKEWEC